MSSNSASRSKRNSTRNVMEHLAILNPKLQLLPKILSGEKTIESRWYKHKTTPWNKIQRGDTIYFKNASQPVTATAKISKVLQIQVSSLHEALSLAKQYKEEICLSDNAITETSWLVGKRYVILVYLQDAKKITPFSINKSGFGNACAWITCPKIAALKFGITANL